MAHSSAFEDYYNDILRIELTGPEKPHLTMVDLPGLYRTGNKNQSDADVDIVRGMVKRYMKRPRSIILTVVSAKNEYVLQEVTSMAKHADPEGLRTMGLITKPDTLDFGSDTEEYFVRLAQNQEEKLRLGWHVLKNRSFEERDFSLPERDASEKEFFSKGSWASIDSTHCGVSALRVRLSGLLRDQILSQLPGLIKDVEDGVRDCSWKLDRLGPVRGSSRERMQYLHGVSEEYTELITQAVEGTYTHSFFGKERSNIFGPRLRAIVQFRLDQFAEDMRRNGHTRYIVDSDSEDVDEGPISTSQQVTRSSYLKEVANHLKYNRGRELPCLFNPHVIGRLFVEQSEPWRGITRRLAGDVMDYVHSITQSIVVHISATDVADNIVRFLHQKIDALKIKLDAQLNQLLKSAMQPPITYNPELVKNVQHVKKARRDREIRKRVRDILGPRLFDDPDATVLLNLSQVLNIVEDAPEPNMDLYGSAMAVDHMEAYYKVAMDRFIDDVSTIAVEDCLISRLPALLKSAQILELSDEELDRLAGETRESSLERQRLEEKRKVLEEGLAGLRSLHKRSSTIMMPRKHRNLSEESGKTPSEDPDSSAVSVGFHEHGSSDVASRPPSPRW